MSGFGGMMVASYIPSTISTVTYANMVFNLDAAGYGALPGNVITTSASFDGNTQYLTSNSSAGIQAGDFTAEGWFYPTNVTGAHALWTFGQASDGRYTVQLNGTALLTNLFGAGVTNYTSNVSINAWTHIAMVRSGTTVSIYINGTASATTDTQSGTIGNSGNLVIGADDSAGALFAGRISNFRIVSSALYTGNTLTVPTSTLRPIAGTQLLLPLVATPFMDISTNESTITNNGTVTTTASAPSLTAITTDLTGTYAMTRTGASISWKSTGTGGYFEKNNATGTDHITGGPNYNAIQSYTVLMAYQGDTRSGGRLLNSGSEASNDWTAGVYFNGATYSKNVWYPSAEVRLNGDTFSPNSGWNFLWGTYDKTNGNAHVYIAASGVNSTVGPTDVYKYANVGMGSTHGFNQLRLWSRYFAGEVQSGNIGLLRVYDGVMPLAQIQSTWANLHSRFGI